MRNSKKKNSKKYHKNYKKSSKKKINCYNKKTKKKGRHGKNMIGGLAIFNSDPSTSSVNTGNVKSISLGNNVYSKPSYTKSDTPSAPPSAISYIPSPIMELKWSFESGLKYFFNNLFGQPRQLSSSVTDQPIGNQPAPVFLTPVSSSDLNNFKNQIINTYTTRAN